MQIKPVTKADKPEYPTASEIDIPLLLNASKPNKWKRNAAIGAVMVGLTLGNDGCDKKIDNKIPSVAPLFEHGNGKVAFGCIIVTPPVFIDEKEAKEIINQEFEKNGIALDSNFDSSLDIKMCSERNLPWNPLNFVSFEKKMFFYSRYLRYVKSESLIHLSNLYTFKIDIDAVNIKEKMAIVFLSLQDDNKFVDTALPVIHYCSVYKVDLKAKSSVIQNAWYRNDFTLAVFYDPIHRVKYEYGDNENSTIKWKEAKRIAKNQSKDSLRAQVRDFLKWYKENKGKK